MSCVANDCRRKKRCINMMDVAVVSCELQQSVSDFHWQKKNECPGAHTTWVSVHFPSWTELSFFDIPFRLNGRCHLYVKVNFQFALTKQASFYLQITFFLFGSKHFGGMEKSQKKEESLFLMLLRKSGSNKRINRFQMKLTHSVPQKGWTKLVFSRGAQQVIHSCSKSSLLLVLQNVFILSCILLLVHRKLVMPSVVDVVPFKTH